MNTTLKKQLLMHIFQLLVQQGLLREEEENRLKILLGSQKNS